MFVGIMGDYLDRVKTGIKGFDELIEGGFPKGFNVLFTGLPGTGKTIFGQQFLYNGAMDNSPGVYVSLDMSCDIFRAQGDQFGWDIERLEKENKLAIVKVPLDRKRVRLFDMIREHVERIKAKRLVFDSLAAFEINIDQFDIPLVFDDDINKIISSSNLADKELFYSGDSKQRVTFLTLNHLSKFGTTNLIITDQVSEENKSTVDGVSEYVCDGVVNLHAIEGEEAFNTLNITKMRLTNAKRGVYNFAIDKTGITIKE